MGLPVKQRVFVEEYLRCWSATKAARVAGYAHPDVQGPRLLGNVRVSAEVKRQIAEKTMGADEVLVRLGEQARGEGGQYIKTRRRPAFTLGLPDGSPGEGSPDEDTPAGELPPGELPPGKLPPGMIMIDEPYVDVAQMRTDDRLHLVKKLAVTKQGITVEFYDAQAALTQIGRHLGLFVDKVAPTDPTGEKEYSGGLSDDQRLRAIQQLLDRARERAAGQAADEAVDVDAAAGAPDGGISQPGG